jgi:hypothetical protein
MEFIKELLSIKPDIRKVEYELEITDKTNISETKIIFDSKIDLIHSLAEAMIWSGIVPPNDDYDLLMLKATEISRFLLFMKTTPDFRSIIHYLPKD